MTVISIEVESRIRRLSLLHPSKSGLVSGWNLLWRTQVSSELRVLHIGVPARDDRRRRNVNYAAERIIYDRTEDQVVLFRPSGSPHSWRFGDPTAVICKGSGARDVIVPKEAVRHPLSVDAV